MTAVEIIEAIRQLPAEEQIKVLALAQQVVESRRLSPEELGELAKRLQQTPDAAEADRLEDAIMRGFYGRESNA